MSERKKIIKSVPILMSVLLVILLFFIFQLKSGKSLNYLLGSISKTDYEQLQENLSNNQQLMSDDDIEIQYNGTLLPYTQDGDMQTYYLSSDLESDNWTGILDFSQQSNEEVSMVYLDDSYAKDKRAAIQEGHVFQLLVYDQNEYQNIQLIVTGTPICDVSKVSYYMEDSEDGSDEQLEIDEGIFTLLDGSGKFSEAYNVVSDPVDYHVRGSSSKVYDKKSYSIKLLDEDGDKKQENLLGMGLSAKWKLNSLYNESSKVREKTAYTIWDEIATEDSAMNEHGASMEYCEVIIDHQYMGLYGLVYPIDEETQNLEQNDILYKVFSWNMDRDDFISHMEAGDRITADVEIDYPNTSEDWTKLWQPMFDHQEYGYWNVDVEREKEGIKIDNQLDYYLFLQVTEANDNMFKNSYFVYRESDQGKMTMIPWDLNYSFGAIWMSDLPYMTYCAYPDVTNMDAYVLYMQDNLIYNSGDDTIWNRLCDLYATYRSEIFNTQHIQEMMQSDSDYLVASGALDRDRELWPESEDIVDLSEMFDHISQRLEFLDTYFVKK